MDATARDAATSRRMERQEGVPEPAPERPRIEPFALSYADPTGERAVRNVMREAGGARV